MSKGKGKLLVRGCFLVTNQAAAVYGNDATKFLVEHLKSQVTDVPYESLVLSMDRIRIGFVIEWELRA